MILHNNTFCEQWSRLLISGADTLTGMPMLATACALLSVSTVTWQKHSSSLPV